MSHQSIARFLEQIAQFVLTIEYVISKQANLLNKLLSDISALLLHTCVQLRQPINWLKQPKVFYSEAVIIEVPTLEALRLRVNPRRLHGAKHFLSTNLTCGDTGFFNGQAKLS